MSGGAESKKLTLAIFALLPDDPHEAVSALCIALAFAATGAGYPLRVIQPGIDTAFQQAERAKRELQTQDETK